jgi:LysM repeat protein
LTYIVQDGDTCGVIASVFNISVQNIILENSLSADCALYTNQELKIPHPTPTPTLATPSTLTVFEATIEACPIESHIVQANETLETISNIYGGVPVETIMQWNGLIDKNIFIGQVLIIPRCEQTWVYENNTISTVTPSPAPPYPAPVLLLPLDGATFTSTDNTIILQWSSVGTLRDNEAYQVTVTDVTEGKNRQLIDQVTDTKYILPESFLHQDNSPHLYRWFIQPVVQRGMNEDRLPRWDYAGPSSETWAFILVNTAP